MNRPKLRFVLCLVVVLLLLSGCTILDQFRKFMSNPDRRGAAASIMQGAGTGLKVAAGVVAATPLAPLAPILAGLGFVAAGAATVIRPRGGVTIAMDDQPTTQPTAGGLPAPVFAAPPSLLRSRKTKIQCLSYVAAGVIMFAQLQWPEAVPEHLAIAALGVIAWIAKGNIDGIATEDAAKWSATGNGTGHNA